MNRNMRYIGSIKNNALNGKGVLSFTDGRNIKGTFLNNKFHGNVIYKFPDNTKEEGEYIYGIKKPDNEIYLRNPLLMNALRGGIA